MNFVLKCFLGNIPSILSCHFMPRIKCQIISLTLRLWAHKIIGRTDKLGWQWINCRGSKFGAKKKNLSTFFFCDQRKVLKEDQVCILCWLVIWSVAITLDIGLGILSCITDLMWGQYPAGIRKLCAGNHVSESDSLSESASLLLYFYLFIFLPYSLHVEVPQPGMESKLQLWPIAQLWQCQILNPLPLYYFQIGPHGSGFYVSEGSVA